MKVLLRALPVVLALGVAAADEPKGYVEVDYSKLERKIAKEPKYVAEPLYALFILDDPGKFRVWAVLDKSKKDLDVYDVLYVDGNGNGDLTEKDERFEGKRDSQGGVEFVVGRVEVPGTGIAHRNFTLGTVPSCKGVWFELWWENKDQMCGGHGPAGYDNTSWGKTPEKAPVFRPTPHGPLSFAIWGDGKLALGRATRLSLLAGNKGSGPDTLCPVRDTFLVAGKDRIFATVIAKDAAGKEVKLRNEITEHC
jgi:hypothetical protein